MLKLYYHFGSSNHGCEAIVRSTKKLFNENVQLYSLNEESDYRYELDRIVKIDPDIKDTVKRNSVEWVISALGNKLFHDDYLYTKYERKGFFSGVRRGDKYLSIGGDNYCYSGQDILSYYNRGIHQKGGKTVLWGCSIEPSMFTPSIEKDLSMYDLIVARESISYEYLKIINPNTLFACDPAFTLQKKQIELPEKVFKKKTIGLNISPVIIRREKSAGIAYNNYIQLMKYLLDKTDYNIALIPHVVDRNNDDRVVLNDLYKDINNQERVCLIQDHNCMELKYVISQCEFFIGARTHATIAAYSSFVPTLVVGYSTKADGIAKDLFGTSKNYVISVQSLENPLQLTQSFLWLQENERAIYNKLTEIIPKYTQSIHCAINEVENL